MHNANPHDTQDFRPPISNLAFYHFFHIDDPQQLRVAIKDIATKHHIKGTILIANEGLNAMVAADHSHAQLFLNDLLALPHIPNIEPKISYSNRVPFQKLVVKVKPEIVTMRVDGVDASCQTAEQLPPETLRDWIRSDEPMVLIDTRNNYECQLGSFVGAIDPETNTFNEFPQWVEQHLDELKDKKIVMFCTGGIRCEKATSWMIDQGFPNLYQLEGGVLNYFLKIPDAEKDWKGDLFVFDDRVAINTKSEETNAQLCKICGRPFVVHSQQNSSENSNSTHDHICSGTLPSDDS